MNSLNKNFIFLSISIIVGIFSNNLLLDFTKSFIVLLILIVLFFNFYFYTKKYLIFLILIIIGIINGFIISQINLHFIGQKQNIINKYFGNNKYLIQVQIKKIHSIQEYNNVYLGEILMLDGNKINKNINALFYTPKYYKLNTGNIIEINTKLLNFKNTSNFKLKEYYLSKNIYFKSYLYSYIIIKTQKLNLLQNYIINIKSFFKNTANKIYPKEEAIFLLGILIGSKENIPSDLKNDFNNSGLTHIIAVSGFNITILIIFLSYALKFVPIILKSIIISLTIVFFALIVGDGASVIRASIMGIIGYNILISGRKGNPLAIISLTSIIMLIYSPLSINYDVSYHLSFLALIGIIYTQSYFIKLFNFLPNFLEIKNAFVLTLSALSFTLPIIFFNFGQLSIISPLANLMVGWTIPLSMFLGFCSIIVYNFSNIFGIYIGYLTWILLKWDILIIHLFGNQNWAIIKYDFGNISNYIEVMYFILLIFLLIYFKKEKNIIL